MNKPEVRNGNAIGSVREYQAKSHTGFRDRAETVLVHSIIPADLPENKRPAAMRGELIREIAQRRGQGI
ncbi:MAG: hypothetical protein GY917_13470 [Planctomycetaceae bacterium]|nr:hypothetical protein [Planctomycetaceae bacterium]MCP4817162.1 hypothetical protein [Planctomycetaceae bacterium]